MTVPKDFLPQLPPTYVEHLVRPRHQGDVEDAHAAGEAGSMVGGLGVRVTLKYGTKDGHPVIEDARGRAFGSIASVAALSWLTDTVRGRDPDEVRSIEAADVRAALTGHNGFELPERTTVATRFVVRALRSALGDRDAGPPADPNGPGVLVCRCLGIGDRTIRAVIQSGALDPEAIGDACHACTGCRSCRGDLLALIDEELVEPLRVPSSERHPIEQVALVHAGRLLRGLGMELADARVDGSCVRIRIGSSVPRAMVTPTGAVAITRHVLREVVWDGAHVELDA